MEAIRPARVEDATGIAYVHVESWRTTYKGLVLDDYLAQLTYEPHEQIWTRALSNSQHPQIIFVALDSSGRIVGFIAGGAEREGDPVYRGELYAIYLLTETQGHGLGRRLALALVEKLIQAGYSTMLVWVLTTNPAARFYEALGGQHLRTKPLVIGGAELEETAYGWQDIRLIQA